MTRPTGVRQTCAACGMQADTDQLALQQVVMPERGLRWVCVRFDACQRRVALRAAAAVEPKKWRRR